MSSAELPETDAIEQQRLIDDVEDHDDVPQLPVEVDPADAAEQHRGLDGDYVDDYPRD